jgi:hypothetical protein
MKRVKKHHRQFYSIQKITSQAVSDRNILEPEKADKLLQKSMDVSGTQITVLIQKIDINTITVIAVPV